MAIEIQLTRGYVAIVDDVDSDLAEMKWCYCGKDNIGYAWHRKGYQYEWLHKLILERILNRPLEKGELGDHINNNRMDCRRSNLRLATYSQNARNRPEQRDRLSKYKGVSKKKRSKKWESLFRINGKVTWLGNFATDIDAHRAYCIAALTHHGEFANFGTNSPFKGWTLEQLEAAA